MRKEYLTHKYHVEPAQAAHVKAWLQGIIRDQAMTVLGDDGFETTEELQSRAYTHNETTLTQQAREQLGQPERWLGHESFLLGDEGATLNSLYQQAYKLVDFTNRVRDVALSPDGTKVLAGSFFGLILMWKVTSEEPLAIWGRQMAGVTSMAFSPDGTLALIGSFGAVQLLDAVSGETLVTLRCEQDLHIGELASVAFSPTGTRIFASTKHEEDCLGWTRIWDWPSGKVLAKLPYAWVMSVAFSPDGARVLTYSDRTMDLWDATSGKQLARVDLEGRVITSMAFSPDGTQVLTGFTDGKIQLWETTTWRVLATLEGHKSSVVNVTFSPSGQLIMTGDSRGLVLLRQAIGEDVGKLLKSDNILYEVGSIHWQDAIHVILAGAGGPLLGRPPLYQSMLEGMW